MLRLERARTKRSRTPQCREGILGPGKGHPRLYPRDDRMVDLEGEKREDFRQGYYIAGRAVGGHSGGDTHLVLGWLQAPKDPDGGDLGPV